MTPNFRSDPAVVRFLRDEFRRGCTVAELIGLARDQWPDVLENSRDLSRHLCAAFGIHPAVAALPGATESGEVPERRLTSILWTAIYENRAAWDDGSAGDWFPEFDTEEADLKTCGLTVNGFAILGSSGTSTVQAIERSRRMLSWQVEAIAELAERLQTRINELEADRLEAPAV